MRLFLLHGLGADHRAFQRFQRLLPAEWPSEALDLLGHGDAPKPSHGYSLNDHAAYMAAELELRDVSAAEPAIMIGHSYGAATSVALAATHPELVKGIVLLDPVLRLNKQGHGENSLTGRIIQAKRDGTLATVIPEAYPEASTALQQWTISTWEKMAIGVVEEFDLEWNRFAELVNQPVAIIHGDLEQGGAGDLAGDYFDDPKLMRIAGAGHYLHATHAREVAQAVVDSVNFINSSAVNHGDA